MFFWPLPYGRIFSDRRNKHARPFWNPVQVTLVEVTPEKDIRLMIEIQSSRWRWNIGITQVYVLFDIFLDLVCNVRYNIKMIENEHRDNSGICCLTFSKLFQTCNLLFVWSDLLRSSGGAVDEDGWQERLWSQESINVRKILSFSESEFKLQDLLEKKREL